MEVLLIKLKKDWWDFAKHEAEGRVLMHIPFDVVEEDTTMKVPLIWDGTDLNNLKNLDGLVEAVKGKRVLEIGGGNGYLAYYLSHFAKRYDVYETFPPYVATYAIYIQPYVVKERLPLNYIVKFLTDDDLKYLDEYDVGIYSGLNDADHILSMLKQKCTTVIHIRPRRVRLFSSFKKELIWELMR